MLIAVSGHSFELHLKMSAGPQLQLQTSVPLNSAKVSGVFGWIRCLLAVFFHISSQKMFIGLVSISWFEMKTSSVSCDQRVALKATLAVINRAVIADWKLNSVEGDCFYQLIFCVFPKLI